MRRTQKRPVASEEAAEERAFGDDEEQASDCCQDVTAGVEEKELLSLAGELAGRAVRPTLDTMKVLTSMTMLLATTEASAIMFSPRITLRMM